jgi:hypothetical protein
VGSECGREAVGQTETKKPEPQLFFADLRIDPDLFRSDPAVLVLRLSNRTSSGQAYREASANYHE